MRPVTSTISAARHSLGAVAEALLVVAIVATLVVALAPVYGPAAWFAGSVDARGGKASSVTVIVPDGRFGGSVTGLVTGSGTTWVDVVCTSSSGSGGMTTWARPDASGSFTVTLGPTPSWASGSASCQATAGYYAKNGRWRVLATTTFDAVAV